MKIIKVYHNDQCSKSRSVCEILNLSHISYESVNYLLNPPTENELDQLLVMLNLLPEQIVRKSEDEYIHLKLATNPPKNRMEWIKILIQTPILIERPIITDGTRAIIGRPPELVTEFLKKV